MTSYILDASVAAKWLLPRAGEPLSGEATQLLRDFSAGSVDFSVPDLFWCELANVLWKAVGVGRISSDAASSAIEHATRLAFKTEPTKPLLPEALKIATRFQRTVCDSVYVALAIASRCPLVTADERLVNALSSRFPVRWLGALC